MHDESGSMELELQEQIEMQRCALSEIEDALEAEPSEDLSQVRSRGSRPGTQLPNHAWMSVKGCCYCTQMQGELREAICELEAALLDMKKARLLESLVSMEVNDDNGYSTRVIAGPAGADA